MTYQKKWNTKDEILFLQKIGKTYVSTEPQIKFLKGYIESAQKRAWWGNIDKKIAVKQAKLQLANKISCIESLKIMKKNIGQIK